MRIRMMPVRTLFSRIPRLVRDLSLREGREVAVTFSGEETELDKTVIERLSDPLVHLIRNAIGHGIESQEERLAAGKPAEGQLKVTARHQGNIVIIEVEDDGRGIDFERIRQRFAEAGLAPLSQVSRLDRRELLAALFLPGFSTAERVSDVSGRGVGLDVVKRNIESLGGQVDAASEPGRFSRFTIRIPLTMAIMQALLVRVWDETYAIPVAAVLQAERITRSRIYSVESQKAITIRNSVIPLVELEEIFAYNYDLETGRPRQQTEGQDRDSAYVVVVQGEGREIGIVVDGLVGTQDIVIKSLEDELADGRGIAGASILGDGTVTLILDVGEIQRMVLDGQHSEELRRSETVRRLERYIAERGLPSAERAAQQLAWPIDPTTPVQH
jgi:two-component system, chemotaxis family, sensor kinase CheA